MKLVSSKKIEPMGFFKAVTSLFVLVVFHACTGKVANVAAVAGGASASLSIVTRDLQGIRVGDVSSGITTLGGVPPLTFQVASGALPLALKLDSAAGSITGRIDKSLEGQNYTVGIVVTDSTGQSVTRAYSGIIGAGADLLKFYSSKIADFMAGLYYSYPLVVTGGSEPYKFDVSDGLLPEGISLDAESGYLSGMPAAHTVNQSYSFTVRATDGKGDVVSATYVGIVRSSSASEFAVITPSLPSMTAGASYGASIAVIGGAGPFVFTIPSGQLPAGLSLNKDTGLISGTPELSTSGKSFILNLTVTDSKNQIASMTFAGKVNAYTTFIVPSALPDGRPGSYYSASLGTVGGQAGYIYKIESGLLPQGVELNTTSGAISGLINENEAGVEQSFSVSSTDANGTVSTKDLKLKTSNYLVALTTSSLQDAFEGIAYSNGGLRLSATGGSAPYSFEYTGTLPSGLGLTSAGEFLGSPALETGQLGAGRAWEFSVRARDSQGFASALVRLTIKVKLQPVTVKTSSLPAATLGAPYSTSLLAQGGRGPYTFAVISGTLPAGLNQTPSGSGVITGSATANTACPVNKFSVVVTDDLDQTSPAVDLCIATASGVGIANTSFPPIIIGQNYNVAVIGKGGVPGYLFEASNLPDQISLHPTTGLLSGFTGASIGDQESFITIYDSSSPKQYQSLAFTFRVRNQLQLPVATLPRAATGIVYNGSGYQFQATGGKSPYSYSLVSGSLPTGLSLSPAGLLTGSPAYNTAAYGGTYTFGVNATDADGQTVGPVSHTLYVTVAPKIIGARMPIAVVGTPYAYDIQRYGGVNMFASATDNSSRLTYAVSGLPSGLSFGTKTGRIYGTPTTSVGSPYTISVSLTDQYGFATTKNLILQVNNDPKTLDLRAARISDPCTGQASNCNPQAHDIAALTNNGQQFFIYVRHDVSPRNIQIAKIDPSGRIPFAGADARNRAYPLTTLAGVFNFATINHIRAADIDSDGFLDIAFVDQNSKNFCVMWNPGNVSTIGQGIDSTGMPNFTAASMNCFPVPLGFSTANLPFGFVVRDDLRPDSANNGKKDVVIAVSSNGAASHAVILKTNCSVAAPCAASSRSNIFEGYVSASVTGLPGGNQITLNSATGFENIGSQAYVFGTALGTGVTVSSKSSNTLTLSGAPNGSAVGTTVTALSAASYTTGAYVTSASTISGLSAATIANIKLGQQVTGTGIASGTVVTGVNAVTNSITIFPVASGSGSGPLMIFGPTVHIPRLVTQSNSVMTNTYYPVVGWFVGPKPNFPSTLATSESQCPGIGIAGVNAASASNSFVYIARQTFASGQCQGDFQTHAASDEWQASGGTPWLGQLVAEDFNGDKQSDIAVTVTNNAANSNSANIRVYLTNLGAAFTGGTQIFPQLQSRNASTVVTTGANKIAPYCPDGSSSCTFPSLIVTCGGGTTYGCLTIIPNQCTSAPCSTPFEASTPTSRIDYPAPTGQAFPNAGGPGGQDIMMKPLVSTSFSVLTGSFTSGSNQIQVTSGSTANVLVGQQIYSSANYTFSSPLPSNAWVTAVSGNTITMNVNAAVSGSSKLYIAVAASRNDVALAGVDTSTSNNFLLVYGKNGSSKTDPLKGPTTFDSYPNAFLQQAEIGTTKVMDADGDGRLDLFAFAPNQGFVGAYMGAGGSPAKGISSWPDPSYLSSPNAGGCPNGAAFCLPDPVFNSMGVQQQFPTGWFFDDATMDMGDLDNNGIADIVVNGFASRGVAVSLGTASGDVKQPVLYPIGSNADYKPRSVKLADLDQDGFLDIVVIGSNLSQLNTTGFAVWMRNNGDGTFANPGDIRDILSTTATCNDPSPRSVAAVDIDLDGRPELAVLCHTNQSVWVSRRNTAGIWILQSGASINTPAPGASGWSMKWGRLGTGSASGVDLVVTGLDANSTARVISNVTISSLTPEGNFNIAGTPGSNLTLNGYPAGVDIADFNGDGLGDVVVGMMRTSGISLTGATYVTCLTNATGNCTVQSWGHEGTTTTSVTAADTNDDGLPELFVGFNAGRLIYRTIAAVFNLSQ